MDEDSNHVSEKDIQNLHSLKWNQLKKDVIMYYGLDGYEKLKERAYKNMKESVPIKFTLYDLGDFVAEQQDLNFLEKFNALTDEQLGFVVHAKSLDDTEKHLSEIHGTKFSEQCTDYIQKFSKELVESVDLRTNEELR